MKTDPTFWLLARASGMTAYALLTAAVVAGLVVKSRPFGRRVKSADALDLHRALSLLGLGALALHGGTLALDRTVHLSPAALVVPGLSTYRPLPVALGVVALELMVVLVVSFSLRRRIGMRAWRTIHWAAYAVFAMATAHGLYAGTDSARPWAQGFYLGAVGAVAFATAWRALDRPIRLPAPERST